MKKKFLCALILSLFVLSSLPSLEAPEPDLKSHPDDNKEVLVTIYQMRQSLWYREAYKIQWSRAEAFKMNYDKAKGLAEESAKMTEELKVSLESSRLVSYILGGVAATSIIITVIILLVK